MALTPQIRVSQAGILSGDFSAPQIRTSQAGILSAINYPTEQMRTSQAGILSGLDYNLSIRVSQVAVLVATRGRVANPRLRAWTFSLDGHNYYVLRLGDTSTLVYDFYSEQWMEWSSSALDFWRPNVGVNWVGAESLADVYGSNIVAGDDTFGLLWFLDPEQAYDEHPDSAEPVQEQFFERIVMGQVTLSGREVQACYALWLGTDMGNPAYTGATITLYSSDNSGVSFNSHGSVVIVSGDATYEPAWYSLGQISAPGRLFKIIDDGAVARIDSLDMNDGG